MAIHNVIGDSFRGATWVSIHNGGGVGWCEVINGGFGLLLDGTEDANRKLKNMLYFDVHNGISRRAWARNKGAINSIERAHFLNNQFQITLPYLTDEALINKTI
jgi:urocanate hydratase